MLSSPARATPSVHCTRVSTHLHVVQSNRADIWGRRWISEAHTHTQTHTKQGWLTERFLLDNVGICCTRSILLHRKSSRLTSYAAVEQNKLHNSAGFKILIWVLENLWMIARLEEIETAIRCQTAVISPGRQIGRKKRHREKQRQGASASYSLVIMSCFILHSIQTLQLRNDITKCCIISGQENFYI